MPIQDARRRLFLPEAATCASTSVVTQNLFSAAMRTARSRVKEDFPAKRIVIDMKQSTDLAYHANGKDVKGSLVESIT